MQKLFNILVISTLCFVLLACNQVDKVSELVEQVDKTRKLGEEFELKADETAKIADTGIYLKGKGSGHTIEKGGHSEYCIFEVEDDDKPYSLEVYVGETSVVKDYKVKVNGIDLFKSCTLVVNNKK